MQKKDILLGAGLTSVLVGVGVVNTTVQADEITQPTKSTTVQKAAVTGQDLTKAQEVAKSAQLTVDQKTADVKVAEDQQLTSEKAVADVKEDIKTAQKAATIVEEQNKVIGTKNEQKSQLNAELSDAKTAEQTAKMNL